MMCLEIHMGAIEIVAQCAERDSLQPLVSASLSMKGYVSYISRVSFHKINFTIKVYRVQDLFLTEIKCFEITRIA